MARRIANCNAASRNFISFAVRTSRKLQKTITFKPEVKEEPSATPQRGAEIEKRLENAP
jgi:hypothetical protein